MVVLRYGAVGPDVARWQKVIGAEPDGHFGRVTEATTKVWQRAHGLDPDGIVGPVTWRSAEDRGALPHRAQPDTSVPVVRTPVLAGDYARAVILAWRKAYQIDPSKASVGVLWAQYMVETGGVHVYNWNIGNVKEIPGDGLPYQMLHGVWEIVGGERVNLEPPDRGTWFTAFPNLATAMEHHFGLLRRRFSLAWPHVLSGDPDGFARALKAQRYYTAPADAYAAGMRAHHAAWMRSKHFEAALVTLEEPGS